MPEHRIYELIARKLSGEATAAEIRELSDYLQQHGGDQYLYELLTTWWSQHPDLLHEDSTDEEERFQRILHATEETSPDLLETETITAPVKKIYRRRWFSYAAVVAGLAGMAIVAWPYIFRKPMSPAGATAGLNEVVARSGSKSKMVLPDGTQVWLNADSKITYLNNFNQTIREVSLEGEAFFDVTHDPQRPFIVHTSGIDIKVLGTAFNVKSYEADATIEATLLRGSIEVVRQNDDNAPKIILRPNEKLVFNKVMATPGPRDTSDHTIISSTVKLPQAGIAITTIPGNIPDSIMKETSWVYNKLIFEGDSFSELAEKMERWYNVQITIKSERVRQYRLKGIFENETIREALEALKLTAPFEYRIIGNEVEIYRK